MAKKKASRVPPSSISARFSPATIQSMDLLRWYLALSNNSPELEESRDKGSDTRDSRNQIATQALTWFAKPANNKDVVYPHLKSKNVLRSFTVSPELYSTISEIAERDEVKFARLVETAFQLYCEHMISDAMRAYYSTVQHHGSSLLRTQEKRRTK